MGGHSRCEGRAMDYRIVLSVENAIPSPTIVSTVSIMLRRGYALWLRDVLPMLVERSGRKTIGTELP